MSSGRHNSAANIVGNPYHHHHSVSSGGLLDDDDDTNSISFHNNSISDNLLSASDSNLLGKQQKKKKDSKKKDKKKSKSKKQQQDPDGTEQTADSRHAQRKTLGPDDFLKQDQVLAKLQAIRERDAAIVQEASALVDELGKTSDHTLQTTFKKNTLKLDGEGSSATSPADITEGYVSELKQLKPTTSTSPTSTRSLPSKDYISNTLRTFGGTDNSIIKDNDGSNSQDSSTESTMDLTMTDSLTAASSTASSPSKKKKKTPKSLTSTNKTAKDLSDASSKQEQPEPPVQEDLPGTPKKLKKKKSSSRNVVKDAEDQQQSSPRRAKRSKSKSKSSRKLANEENEVYDDVQPYLPKREVKRSKSLGSSSKHKSKAAVEAETEAEEMKKAKMDPAPKKPQSMKEFGPIQRTRSGELKASSKAMKLKRTFSSSSSSLGYLPGGGSSVTSSSILDQPRSRSRSRSPRRSRSQREDFNASHGSCSINMDGSMTNISYYEDPPSSVRDVSARSGEGEEEEASAAPSSRRSLKSSSAKSARSLTTKKKGKKPKSLMTSTKSIGDDPLSTQTPRSSRSIRSGPVDGPESVSFNHYQYDEDMSAVSEFSGASRGSEAFSAISRRLESIEQNQLDLKRQHEHQIQESRRQLYSIDDGVSLDDDDDHDLEGGGQPQSYYDPTRDQSFYVQKTEQSRRRFKYALMAAAVCVVIIIGAVVGVVMTMGGGNDSEDSAEPQQQGQTTDPAFPQDFSPNEPIVQPTSPPAKPDGNDEPDDGPPVVSAEDILILNNFLRQPILSIDEIKRIELGTLCRPFSYLFLHIRSNVSF